MVATRQREEEPLHPDSFTLIVILVMSKASVPLITKNRILLIAASLCRDFQHVAGPNHVGAASMRVNDVLVRFVYFLVAAPITQIFLGDIPKTVTFNNAVSGRSDCVIRPFLSLVDSGRFGRNIYFHLSNRGLAVFFETDGVVQIAHRAAVLTTIKLFYGDIQIDFRAGYNQVRGLFAPHPSLDLELDFLRPCQAFHLHTGKGIIGEKAAPGHLGLWLFLHDRDFAQTNNIHTLVTAALFEIDGFRVNGKAQFLIFAVKGQPDLIGVRVFCEEQNRIAEKAVSDAIQVICGGGVLKNDTVKFYRSRYHASSCSIVLYLMRQYHVDVPLRTQGWINNKLISVTIKDGWCTGERYLCSGKKRGSEKFFIYMDRLIRAVAEQQA